ncbi:hypothetical protein J6590_079248 [Homalodisca vitripennis]|nr:hypothetical protein J6590_079248 [Homalodisca vitripennis]
MHATTLLYNSQINPNRQKGCDVQKARARPNDPTGEGGSHRTPGVALAVVFIRTSHQTAAAGPDDGRGGTHRTILMLLITQYWNREGVAH